MKIAAPVKLRPVERGERSKLRPLEHGGRKSLYEGGFANGAVAVAWSCCPGRVSKKWDPFCEALPAVYRDLGRRRLQAWLSALSTQEEKRPQATGYRNLPRPKPKARSPRPEALCSVSDAELGMIWRRSEGFVRQHKRRPFEANMRALHELDPAGFWLLISELDFRERLGKA